MRVALVHYWLVGMRGGEKVLEALCEIFPVSDIFTHVYVPEAMSPAIRSHNVRTTMIGKLPFASKLYQYYLPLMPLALEQLDLRSYDLVISSESGPAKGVLTRPDALHVCYCHSPMRYLWSMYHDYIGSVNPILRPLARLLASRLRLLDYQAAMRVDLFVANSHNIARQIKKYYGSIAKVVPPPVDVDAFPVGSRASSSYLSVGQLVRYKRFDLAIEACNHLQRDLVVIGDGEEFRSLKKIAGPTITFLGRQDFDTLRDHYARCRALIFPGEEDFGIVPVEAMAAGKVVIAYGRGGALETVVPRITGCFFHEQSVKSLTAAILEFEEMEETFKPMRIVQHAQRFSRDAFKLAFANILREQFGIVISGGNVELAHGDTRRTIFPNEASISK